MRINDNEHNIEGLINRYEESLKAGRPGYFDVDELENISEFYRSVGNDKESENVIDYGLKMHPGSSILLLKKASLFADIGDYRRALKIVEKLPEKDDEDVLMLKAEILIHSDRFHEGMSIFNRLLEQNTEDRAQMALDISSVLSEMSMFEKAESVLNMILAEEPKNIEVLEELAYCLEQGKKYNDAISIYEKILDIDPYSNETWFNLGQAWFNLESWEKAVEAYEFALTISEHDFIARLQKAHALFQGGRYQEAADSYQEYMDMDEKTAYLLVFQAEAYEKAGLYKEAIKIYTEAYKMSNDNLDAITGLAICFMERKNYSKSLFWFDKALKINDQDPEIWTYVAELMIQMDLKDEAYLSYLRSLSLNNEQPDVLTAIGNLNFDEGEYEKALDFYKMAFSLDPDTTGINLYFALVYSKLGFDDLSGEYLKKAKDIDENSVKLFMDIIYGSDNQVSK